MCGIFIKITVLFRILSINLSFYFNNIFNRDTNKTLNVVGYEKVVEDNRRLLELNNSLQGNYKAIQMENKSLKAINKMSIADNNSFKQKLARINELEVEVLKS